MDILLSDAFESLETVEFKGNTISRKAALEYITLFSAKKCKLIMFEEDDDDEGDDDEEEEDEDAEEGADDDDLLAKLEKLKL